LTLLFSFLSLWKWKIKKNKQESSFESYVNKIEAASTANDVKALRINAAGAVDSANLLLSITKKEMENSSDENYKAMLQAKIADLEKSKFAMRISFFVYIYDMMHYMI